jgi:hypothetical protein
LGIPLERARHRHMAAASMYQKRPKKSILAVRRKMREIPPYSSP